MQWRGLHHAASFRETSASIRAAIAATASLPATRKVLGGAKGPELIPVLGDTAKLQISYGVLLAIGLAL